MVLFHVWFMWLKSQLKIENIDAWHFCVKGFLSVKGWWWWTGYAVDMMNDERVKSTLWSPHKLAAFFIRSQAQRGQFDEMGRVGANESDAKSPLKTPVYKKKKMALGLSSTPLLLFSQRQRYQRERSLVRLVMCLNEELTINTAAVNGDTLPPPPPFITTMSVRNIL